MLYYHLLVVNIFIRESKHQDLFFPCVVEVKALQNISSHIEIITQTVPSFNLVVWYSLFNFPFFLALLR